MFPFRLAALTLLLCAAYGLEAAQSAPPVRGLHIAAPRPEELPLAIKFITEALPKEGVNVLVLEFDYRYKFTKRPEMADPAGLSKDDVKALLAACHQANVRLIPQINLLGHQSWAKSTGALLRAHPDFDETPGKYPANEGIYCRSYCPSNPAVHEVVYDLIDELAEACEADAFHVGMDEVFILGDEDCPRCKGKDKAQLFAAEVIMLHDHLAKSNRTMWMWGDRFLNGETSGMGKWEASTNQTYAALHLISKDIMICDWHYERALPTPQYFAVEGFPVLASPWRRPDVALAQLQAIREARTHSTKEIAARMQGVLQTTWGGFASFAKAYFGEETGNSRVVEAVTCFRALFRELRSGDGR
jgi:hypothetical protein